MLLSSHPTANTLLFQFSEPTYVHDPATGRLTHVVCVTEVGAFDNLKQKFMELNHEFRGDTLMISLVHTMCLSSS